MVERQYARRARWSNAHGSLLAGDHDGVMRVVAGWYQQSDERAEQIRNDPAMFEMIKDRRRSIAEKADHRRSA
jgi:hypothetical protein